MRQKSLFMLLAICAAVISAASPSYAQMYQYQYHAKEKNEQNKVPYSDFNPKVQMDWYTQPHYLEDYYLLYGMKQYYDENSLRANIAKMNAALNSKFRHPSEALVKIETEQEYDKYKDLMVMHINMLIMRDIMKIAVRYDKQKIYFYNLDYAQIISDSLDEADKLYEQALPYWDEAHKYAERATKYKITTDMSYIESERFSIMNGDTDFRKIIGKHRESIKKKKQQLAKGLETAAR
jgi:hypothetical protein